MARMPNIQDCPSTFAYDGMAIFDECDQFVDRCGAEGTGLLPGSVLAGSSFSAAVAADGTDLILTVAAGTVQVLGATFAFAGGTVAVAAGSTTDRRDSLVLRSGSLFVIEGTPWTQGTGDGPAWTRYSVGTGPEKPNVTESSDVMLAEVYVPATVSALTQAMLVDKRVVLWGAVPRSSTAHTPGTTASVTSAAPGSPQVAANPNRIELVFSNTDEYETVYLSLGGTPAVGSGIRLNPNGGAWSTKNYLGAVSAICTNVNTGTASLSVAEV